MHAFSVLALEEDISELYYKLLRNATAPPKPGMEVRFVAKVRESYLGFFVCRAAFDEKAVL